MLGMSPTIKYLSLIAKSIELLNMKMDRLIAKTPEEPNEEKIIAGIVSYIQIQKEIDKNGNALESLESYISEMKQKGNGNKIMPRSIFIKQNK